MFRPFLGHLQALWENRSKSCPYYLSSWICFHRGPEDDLIKVETCRPNNILFLLHTKQCCVIDWHVVFICYDTSGWKTLNSMARLTKYSDRIIVYRQRRCRYSVLNTDQIFFICQTLDKIGSTWDSDKRQDLHDIFFGCYVPMKVIR